MAQDDTLWAVNSGTRELINFDLSGSFIKSWGVSSAKLEGFVGCCNPSHFVIMNDGSFVTSEKGLERVKIYNSAGVFQCVVASPAEFTSGTVGLDLAVDIEGNIYVLEADSGKIIWESSLNIDILSTPVVVNNKVYAGNYCLDLNNGNKIWISDVGILLLSSPSYYQNKIFIGSQDEKFYCIDARTGNKIWKFYIGSMSWKTSPSVAYGNVYVGNKFGFIYCLDVDDGEYIWS